jgi:GcrA cell cycle regulator
MSWTDERVETLKTLWGEGQSASQIAKVLGGVTRNAVIGKVHRLGLASRAAAKPEPAKAAKEAAPAPKPKTKAKAVEKAEPAPVKEKPKPVTVSKPPVVTSTFPHPPAPSEPLVDLVDVDAAAKKLSLLELNERTCKWPIGDPSKGEFYFCGHAAAPGKPYCSSHVAAAYQPMSSRRDRDRSRQNRQAAIGRSA